MFDQSLVLFVSPSEKYHLHAEWRLDFYLWTLLLWYKYFLVSVVTQLIAVFWRIIKMQKDIWTATGENAPSEACSQQILKSFCASAQSDQSLRWPYEESLHPWLSKVRPVRILIRLRECAGWSESSPGAHVLRYIAGRFGSFVSLNAINILGRNVIITQLI